MIATQPGSENYQCKVFVVKEYRKHPDARSLWIVTVDGNNVITGVEPKIGQMFAYFPVLSRVNSAFLSFINGFNDPVLNADTNVKGFFTSKCRVKPVKLRGLPSEGYLHPIQDVQAFVAHLGTGEIDFKEGMEFNRVAGILLCEKYVSPTNQRTLGLPGTGKKKGQQEESRLVEGQFALHGSTDQLRKNIHKIQPNSLIEISYKKHGTSLVVGNILVKRELKWHEKLLKKLGVPVVDTKYDIVHASRKVIKYLGNKDQKHYYKTDIWGTAAQLLGDKIPKGFTLYCEIIGFTPEGSYIQKDYDYGCAPGEFKTYVYKITSTNPDGQVINLSTPQIKQFCEKYGLLFADTLLYYGYADDLYPEINSDSTTWQEEFLKRLELEFNEKDCYMCANQVPEEGIVLVVDNMYEYDAYKLKSSAFTFREDKLLEEDVQDIEETGEVQSGMTIL